MEKAKVTRSCGSCRECCKPFAIPEVGKRDANWCQHSSPHGGCAIYDKRPHACRAFVCMWLYGRGDENLRPDIFGAIITAAEWDFGHRNVAVFHFFETQPGSLERPRVKEMIEVNKAAGHIVCLQTRVSENGYDAKFVFSPEHFSEMEVSYFRLTYRQ